MDEQLMRRDVGEKAVTAFWVDTLPDPRSQTRPTSPSKVHHWRFTPPKNAALIAMAPVLSEKECRFIVTQAEAHDKAANGAWCCKRWLAHATTDISAAKIPAIVTLVKKTIARKIMPLMQDLYGLQPADLVVRECFVVKYSLAGQRGVSIHKDDSVVSFNILLNSPTEFGAGGTYFRHLSPVEAPGAAADSKIIRPPRQGMALMHYGGVDHGGVAITHGVRFVLVGFLQLSRGAIAARRG